MKSYRIAIPLFLLFFLWSGIVVSQWLEVPSLDLFIGGLLNRMVGDSSIFDLTVVFLTRESGDFLGVMMVVGICLFAFRKTFRFHGHTGRIAGHMILTSLFALLTYEMLDVVKTTIARPSPAEVLTGFRDATSIYNADVDLQDDYQVLSHRAALYYLFILGAVFRSRQFHWTFMALPLPLLLSRMIIGIDWFSGILAGILFGWLVAAVVTSPPVGRLYEKVEDGCERVWTRYVIFPRKVTYARLVERVVRSGRRRPFAGRASSRTDYLGDILRAYLMTTWGLAEPRSLRPPNKQRIYQVVDRQRMYAFKVCRAAESVKATRPRVLDVMHRLRQEGQPFAPAVIPTRDGTLYSLRDGRLCYLMEWIDGRPLDMSHPDELEEVTRLLARFHNATESHVEVGSLGPVEQFSQWADRFRRKVNALSALTANPALSNNGFLRRLMTEQVRSEAMFNMASFYLINDAVASKPCLIHGDPHPMNYVRTRQGRIMMIDTERIRTGYGFEDLSALLQRYMARFRWDFTLFRTSLDAYLDVRPLPRQEIVLLLAEILFPKRSIKVLEKVGQGPLGPKAHLRILRKHFELRNTSGQRERFFIQSAISYGIPMIGCLFDSERSFFAQAEGCVPSSLEDPPRPSTES